MTPLFPKHEALRGNERTLQPYLKLRRARNRVTDPDSSFAYRIRNGKNDRVSVEPVTSNSLKSTQGYIGWMKIEKNAIKFPRSDIAVKSSKFTASAGNLKFGEGGPCLASQDQVVRTTNAVVVTGIISRQSPFIHKKEFGCGSQIQEWPVKWLPQSRVRRLLFSCNRNTRGHSA